MLQEHCCLVEPSSNIDRFPTVSYILKTKKQKRNMFFNAVGANIHELKRRPGDQV